MAAGPLIVIVGQTASGKTAQAIELAKMFDGEIICADSRTIYKGMDIGTAKPSLAEQQGIPHHLLDIAAPNDVFTVSDFKKCAVETIEDITNRGKLPILVGGSGLYVDSVIYNFQFRPVNEGLRVKFKKASIEELQSELSTRGIDLPENSKNPRYLLRALEAGKLADRHIKLRENTLIIGLDVDKGSLEQRIKKRVDVMVDEGLIDEVTKLGKQYSWDLAPMQAPAYKSFRGYLDGSKDLAQAKQDFVALDFKIAKKQRTWFRRNNSIQWVSDPSEIVDLVTTFLNKVD